MNTRHPIVDDDLRDIVERASLGDLGGRTLLIAGANGFLPAYMTEAILHRNETIGGEPALVLGLVRNRKKAEARFAAYRGRPDLVFIEQDVCRPVSWNGPIDYIIHAASQASPKYFGSDPVGTLAPNVIGTHSLLDLARDKKVQGVLFFSSAEVYGSVDRAIKFVTESTIGKVDPMQVRSCYAESKRMAETMCIAWWHQHGVPVRVVRPFHTYGPGMSLDDGRVFSDFVADVVHQRDIVVKSDGTAIRAYCYLADAVVGFFAALLRGEAGKVYNVGNPDGEIGVQALAELLASLFPERQIRVVRSEASSRAGYLVSEVSRIVPDISRLRDLGWSPVHSLQSGFKRTVLSFE